MHRFRATFLLAVACLLAPVLAAGAERGRTVPDTIAQRALACTTCHGKEGRATNAGWFPRIAGKPAGYLYNQLVLFRDGGRQNAAMAHLVAHLTDDFLRELAEYFAGLDVPYPPPRAPDVPQAVLARGEALARHGDPARGIPSCASCHGARLTGVAPAVPGLLGLPRDYIVGQFAFWNSGQRRAAKPDCMADIVARLDEADVRALGAWLAAQPVPSPAHAIVDPGFAPPVACGSVPERPR